jgi:hypothetical protein
VDPLIIVLICAASFGVITLIAAFVRQVLLSRDKKANDEATQKSLNDETTSLTKMRQQLQESRPSKAHQEVLDDNKKAIFYLDEKIEEIFRKKTESIERFRKLTSEPEPADEGSEPSERQDISRKLSKEVDEQIKFYNSELERLQRKRESLWDAHSKMQMHLLNQEQARNAELDALYHRHSALLEKIYLRNTVSSERLAQSSITASTSTFESMIMAPIQFLMQYFRVGSGIAFTQVQVEQQKAHDEEQKEDLDVKTKPLEHTKAEKPVQTEEESEQLRPAM